MNTPHSAAALGYICILYNVYTWELIQFSYVLFNTDQSLSFASSTHTPWNPSSLLYHFHQSLIKSGLDISCCWSLSAWHCRCMPPLTTFCCSGKKTYTRCFGRKSGISWQVYFHYRIMTYYLIYGLVCYNTPCGHCQHPRIYNYNTIHCERSHQSWWSNGNYGVCRGVICVC